MDSSEIEAMLNIWPFNTRLAFKSRAILDLMSLFWSRFLDGPFEQKLKWKTFLNIDKTFLFTKDEVNQSKASSKMFIVCRQLFWQNCVDHFS